MSIVTILRITCDECGREEDYEGDGDNHLDRPSRREARAYLKDRDWQTGLRATVKRPSLYDVKVDICDYCHA